MVIIMVDAHAADRAGLGARVRLERATNEVMKPWIRVAAPVL